MDATPLSLGALTGLAIDRLSGAEIIERDDHLVVRTASNPTHFWGNCIYVLDPARVNDSAAWLAVFEREFPAAEHRLFRLAAAPDADAWPGFSVEADETLVADAVPRRTPCPDGYVSRAMTTTDWDDYLPFALAENARTGEYEPEAHATYLARLVLARQKLEAAGVARFFGAFAADGTLVSHLGIVVCPPVLGRSGLARYQSVDTDGEHRRRGLAAHLVGLAGAWAAERGATHWVICTQTTNPAGRVYRRAGFVPDAVEHGVERSGAPGGPPTPRCAPKARRARG